MLRPLLISASLVAGSAGCAASSGADRATLDRQSEQVEAIARLEAARQEQQTRIRELEGQLALARAENDDLRESGDAGPLPWHTVQIGDEGAGGDEPADGEGPGVAAEPEHAEIDPEAEYVGEAADISGPRPVLRLHGTPPMAGGPAVGRPAPPLALPDRPFDVPMTLPVTGDVRAGAPPIPVAPAAAPPGADAAVGEYRDALGLVRDRRFAEALTALDAFVSRHPSHPYTDNALYWRGEVFYAQRDYRRALLAFEGVVDRFPRGNRAAEALLKIALCHQRMGNLARARTFFQRVRDQYPDSVAAQIASREEAS